MGGYLEQKRKEAEDAASGGPANPVPGVPNPFPGGVGQAIQHVGGASVGMGTTGIPIVPGAGGIGAAMANPVGAIANAPAIAAGGGIPGVAGGIAGMGSGGVQGMVDTSGIGLGGAKDAIGQIGGLAQQQYDDMSGINNTLDEAGNNYVTGLKGATDTLINHTNATTGAYQGSQQGLSNQAATAGLELGAQNREQDNAMGTLQTRAMANAGQAMSLADAGNVNNAVQTGTRNLYNAEGANQRSNYNNEGAGRNAAYQAEGANRRNAYNTEGDTQEGAYEAKAQGIGREGLAASGMLASLGGQAMAGQMGGASPMTGGQLAAMQGANMSRAGQAYGRAQQQMQGMRDQGMNRKMDQRNQGMGAETQARAQGMSTETAMRGQGLANESSLRGRGIEQGFDQSAAQYGRGQDAQGLAAGIVGQRSGMRGIRHRHDHHVLPAGGIGVGRAGCRADLCRAGGGALRRAAADGDFVATLDQPARDRLAEVSGPADDCDGGHSVLLR